MPLPSNSIATEVIREMMLPYHHSTDLLQANVAAPPPDTAPARLATQSLPTPRLF